jgi:hypothetical protein
LKRVEKLTTDRPRIKLPKRRKFARSGHQGDQIGRIFAYWVIVYYGQFYAKKYHRSKIFGLLLFMVKVMCLFSPKVDWVTFWATFSQTHLGPIFRTFFSTESDFPRKMPWNVLKK